MNEYTGWTQEQLVSSIQEGESAAARFYSQRSEAEKQGRAANKKVEAMRKALTDLLLSPAKPAKR